MLYRSENEMKATVREALLPLVSKAGSQRKLAKEIEITPSQLGGVLRCLTTPPLWALMRACDYAHATPDELLGIPRIDQGLTHALIRAWAQMSAEQQVKLLTMAQAAVEN